MRPTDVCHPNELRVPAPRVFPTRSRHFRSGDAPQSLRLCAVDWGTGRFTTPENASADRHSNTSFDLELRVSRLFVELFLFSSVGVFFPRR
jgi:hypothetical protein